MSVELEFYSLEESTGIKTKLESAYGFGNLFKGAQVKVPIAIFNKGDTEAVNPTAKITEYTVGNGNYSEPYKWKKVSLSKNMGYAQEVKLPTIKPLSWMTGKDVYFEDFSKYPPDSGAKPDQEWSLWGGSDKAWEIYSGYLQHNTDSIGGRACWNTFPTVADFEFSSKITVRDGVFAGYILRDIGDYSTGYIVLVQGISSYFPVGMNSSEGVIQVWKGNFTEGIDKWELLYQSGSIGVRATHDVFKVRLVGNRFDFWYKNDDSLNPMFSFVDNANTYTGKSKPVLCTHAGNGSTLIYFDDLRMEIETPDGLVWIENTVDAKTGLFGTQYSVLELEFGGVE